MDPLRPVDPAATSPRTPPVTDPVSFLGSPGPVALAHRGGAGLPENTLAAFGAAVALGYRFLETDVRATADGVLVAFHDADLDRATDATGPLAARTWEQLAGVRALGSDASGVAEPLVRLEELLEAWPDVRLNVDVKDAAAVAPLVRLLAADRGRHAQRVCVASFSDARRRAVVATLAERGVAATSSAGRAGVVRFLAGARAGLRGAALRRLVGADALQVPERAGPGGRLAVVSERTLAAAASARLPVHVWTVDEAEDVRRLLDAGASGVVTDAAEVVAAVMRERGAWPTPLLP